MNLILWIIFGGLAGWLASMIMRTANRSIVMDMVLGILGAVVGGFVMSLLGLSGVTGFNLYSLLVAVAGAVILIYAGRLLRS